MTSQDVVVVLRVPFPRPASKNEEQWTEDKEATLWHLMGSMPPGRINWNQVSVALAIPIDECMKRSAILLQRAQDQVQQQSTPAAAAAASAAAATAATASYTLNPPPPLYFASPHSLTPRALFSPASPLSPGPDAQDPALTRSALEEAFLSLNLHRLPTE